MAENAVSTAKTPIETNSDLIAEVQSLVDNLPEAGGGSDLKWIDVISLTTTEETNIISVSTDAEGREISGYHALAMAISATIPADETQITDTGSVWIYPMDFPASTNFYRVMVSLAAWKTTIRTINGVLLGVTKAFYGICNSAFTGGNIPETTYTGEIFNGLTIQVQVSEGHLPIGTKVNVVVLSKGWTE